MEKFNNIHKQVQKEKPQNTQILTEKLGTLGPILQEVQTVNPLIENYINALNDLKKAFESNNHVIFSPFGVFKDDLAKIYYENAITYANENKLFSSVFTKQLIKENTKLNSGNIKDSIIENISLILEQFNKPINILNENTGTTLSNTPGMGNVILPQGDTVGSGDTFHAVVYAKKQKPLKSLVKKSNLKTFKKIQDENELLETEIFFSISELNDPSKIIQVIAQDLSKIHNKPESVILQNVANILISYNGIVDANSLNKLAKALGTNNTMLKKQIDEIIDTNISLMETIQVGLFADMMNSNHLNESILGRAIGTLGGFALGPKIGKIIAKVLGIEKGPLYNILTSRIVSAALAQELTKNLL
jgi:hypothetical protein